MWGFEGKIAEALRTTVNQTPEVEFRANYSGRGMYGNKCISIVGSKAECNRVIAQAIILLQDDEDFAPCVETLLESDVDSMGLDVVMYWPDIQI